MVRLADTNPTAFWWGIIGPGGSIAALLTALQRGYLRLGSTVDQHIEQVTQAADARVAIIENQRAQEREDQLRRDQDVDRRMQAERDAATRRMTEVAEIADRRIAAAERLAEQWGQAAERRADAAEERRVEAEQRAEDARRLLEQQVIPAFTLVQQALTIGRLQDISRPPPTT